MSKGPASTPQPPGCVSIVVRAFNEERHIGRLLSGLMRQSVANLEIVLVDSGSSDATVDIARRFPVRVVSINKNDFSFGRALNLGCEATTGDYIVIASAHVYPTYTDWIARLIAPFADPSIALTYGKQRGNDATRYSERRVFAHWFPDDTPRRGDYPFCNNANAAIRRALWLNHRYDPKLTGLEDLEWASRVIDEGHRIAYVPEAEVVHVHEETAAQIFNRYRREAVALHRIYPKQRFSLFDLARLLPANVASDLYHAALDGEFPRALRDVVVFRSMQFLGTYRGFNMKTEIDRELRATFYYPSTLYRSGASLPRERHDKRISYSEPPPAGPDRKVD